MDKKLAGVDLAWNSQKNPSALAVGNLHENTLTVETVMPAVYGMAEVLESLTLVHELSGIAIDAPLIINNATGQRQCEREIGKFYSSRKAACHAANTTLYPNASSVKLSECLSEIGFAHLYGSKWQIECYTHPAVIEVFQLKERLRYKKGRVSEKKAGQKKLAELLTSRYANSTLILSVTDSIKQYMDPAYIDSLRGQGLKSNEDALDAILCLYIAALYASASPGRTFGSVREGYIWVPQYS